MNNRSTGQEKRREEVGLHHALPIDEIEFKDGTIAVGFSLEEYDFPVPCTEILEDEEFCPIMVCSAHRCPGYDDCPGSQHVYNGYLPYHTPIPCPDCKTEIVTGWIEGHCERCYDYRVVALEEAYACDLCEYWRFDHCENCSCWHINLKNRPKKCKHKIPRDLSRI